MFSRYARPIALGTQPHHEILELHQISYNFHREVSYRESFEQYCHWYRSMAECHRQELQDMQADINILGWFCRGARNK
ncbi:MAG: hypothetical protein F6K19_21230 [Cyanothece sp. SIO1E1]|nr:hypothetical protein [Cyanothece sp. SIO1E1]